MNSDLTNSQNLCPRATKRSVEPLGGVLNLGGPIADSICQESGFNRDDQITDVDLEKIWKFLNEILNGDWKGYLFLKRRRI